MYCKKCGTYIDGESELCPACKAQEDFNFDNNTTVVDNTPTYTEEEKYNDRRAGLKGGIAGCILGFIGSIITGIALGLVEFFPVPSIIFILISVALNVISLIKGIQSIKTFINFSKQGKAKPIATLILGIVSLAFSIENFILIFFIFLILIAILMML